MSHSRGEQYVLLLGMDRHQWGTIHLYIGFVLLGLLILRIYLHWKVIVGMYRNLITSPKIRKISLCIFMTVSILLLVVPFAVSPNVVEREPRKRQHGIRGAYENEIKTTVKQPENKLQRNFHGKYIASGVTIETKNRMTLSDVAQEYNVPVDVITDQLGIPRSPSLNVQKIGRLRKIYGFKWRI